MKDEIKIHCHCKDSENRINFFCDITHKQGIEFVLSVYTDQPIEIKNGCFACFDGENNRYILNNLTAEEDVKPFYGKRYYFESLVIDSNKHYLSEKMSSEDSEVKFKTLHFSFPYINTFFYNIDYLKPEDIRTANPALRYHRINEFTPIEIDNFRISLESSYSFGGGKFGGTGGHFDLTKSIKIESSEERSLHDFINVITSLINFFSICLKRKLLISKIWSNETENSLGIKCEIKTFQFYILNKDYQEDIDPYKAIATYPLLKENFESIANRYFRTKEEEFERFPIFCELYMRYNDAPIEILPQMKFLPLMQGIEAYVSKFPYNELEDVPEECEAALKKFKEDNTHLDRVQGVIFQRQLPFEIKINNTIQNLNIENIVDFKLDEGKNYKLINQMVRIRNYYTHYGKYPKISDEDFYDAMSYAKIVCEIFIMKELGFTEEQIKISLDNNYYYLRQIENKYCCIRDNVVIPKGFEDKIYIGEIDSFVNDKYAKYMLFYKKFEDKKQVILYAKNIVEGGETEEIEIPRKLSNSEYDDLDKIFKRCYDNYIESEKQIKYKNDLKKKKSKT